MTEPTLTTGQLSGNGQSAQAVEAAGPAEVMDMVRRRRRNVLLFRGFGPLAVALVLFVLMLLVAPSIAPERIVERPVEQQETTTTASPTTAASTTVAP